MTEDQHESRATSDSRAAVINAAGGFLGGLTLKGIALGGILGLIVVTLWTLYDTRASWSSGLTQIPGAANVVAGGFIFVVIGGALIWMQSRNDNQNALLVTYLHNQIDDLRRRLDTANALTVSLANEITDLRVNEKINESRIADQQRQIDVLLNNLRVSTPAELK